MSELQVMAGSRDSTDPFKDPRLFKAGDVLVARPDGWTWGSEDLSNPLFMIIRVPDMSAADGDMLCAEESGDLITNPTLRIRVFALDLDKIANAASVDGVTRQAPFIDSTKAEIDAAKITKPPAENPMVFG